MRKAWSRCVAGRGIESRTYAGQVLVLADTEMLPWKADVQRVMGHILGEHLQLREGGQRAQAAFCSQVPSALCNLHRHSHRVDSSFGPGGSPCISLHNVQQCNVAHCTHVQWQC